MRPLLLPGNLPVDEGTLIQLELTYCFWCPHNITTSCHCLCIHISHIMSCFGGKGMVLSTFRNTLLWEWACVGQSALQEGNGLVGAYWHSVFPLKSTEAHGDIRHQHHGCFFTALFNCLLCIKYLSFVMGEILCLLILVKFQGVCWSSWEVFES